ncbi:MAG: hypothetical protein D9V47_04780 [Clostridia bacterium]|nr:MAG: hypothetical protein D9V47_04780 [Clostridia bacterium]
MGVLWLRQETTTPFAVEFRYWAGGGTGADGLTFMFYKDKNYGPGSGYGLGFNGAPGYAIEFDSYGNSGDYSGSHIALIKDSTTNHLRELREPSKIT